VKYIWFTVIINLYYYPSVLLFNAKKNIRVISVFKYMPWRTWVSKTRAPHIPNFSNRWRWVVICMLCHPQKSPCNLLQRVQNGCDDKDKKKNTTCPCPQYVLAIQSRASYITDCAINVESMWTNSWFYEGDKSKSYRTSVKSVHHFKGWIILIYTSFLLGNMVV
jgi:hypothetical protein